MQPIFEEIQAGDAVGFYCPISWVELLCYPELLVTRNVEDFRRIDGLNIVNPFEDG